MAGQQPETAVMLYGTAQAPAPIRHFRHGALSFDLEAGKLRYISLNGVEALRCIAFVVRGPGWESPAPRISDLEETENEGGLQIRYKAQYETTGGRLEVSALIRVSGEHSLVFEAEALALTDFTTARTSFCILHPIAGVAGRPVSVTRPDESVEDALFPDHISAHQPFMNIRALAHQVAPGLTAKVRMEGDIWEMEDQRNWTDASFKTYGRPRDLPWPYILAKGERLTQRVLLSFEGASVPAAARPAEVEIGVGEAPAGRLPKLALAVSPEEAGPALAAAVRLAAAPAALLCWFELGVQTEADLRAYALLAGRLGTAISLELILPCRAAPDEELGAAAALLRRAGVVPISLAPIQAPMTKWVLKPPEELGLPGFAEIYRAARRAFPNSTIGAGVTSNFTELNIDRPDLSGADYVRHGTAGVIHEPDDRSVMETLETLPHIFRSVGAFAGALPYRLGPSAIGMRYNPYGKTTEANGANVRVAFAHQDPRQRGLFGAAFALGYLARAAEAGLEAVCFGALTGPFGIIYRKTDYPQPWFDELGSATGSSAPVYPLYHPIMAIAGAADAEVRSVRSSDEKRVLGLCYQRPGEGRMLWLANLTAEAQIVRLAGGTAMTVKFLDASSFAAAARDPAGFAAAPGAAVAGAALRLEPYALALLGD